jgi:hypothetical protein
MTDLTWIKIGADPLRNELAEGTGPTTGQTLYAVGYVAA